MNKRFIPAVIGLAVRPDRRFLLTKRHQPQTPKAHNKWNIPGGGIEWGETPEIALDREFHEELGVTPKIVYPQPIPITSMWDSKDSSTNTAAHILLLCYIVDIGDQEIDLSLDPEGETSEYRWFTLEEARKVNTLPQTIETVTTALDLYAKMSSV